ncbi:MAG: hypothetical protein HZB36_00025 [Candidatus Omnitrophica bacterium]|nr:hypothetical protein [Candidatus Omnitrophota bacterium]
MRILIRKKGFTLVEVALTVGLTSIIALSIYASLSYGLTIWQRVQAGLAEEDAALFFSKLNDELDDVFKYPGFELVGNSSEVKFPTIISDSLHYPDTGRGLGMVKYVFDENAGSIQKAHLSISDIYEGRQPLPTSVLADISALTFSYYFLDKEKEAYIWSAEWPPQEGAPENPVLPLAVRIGLSFQKGDRIYEYNQTFSLPLAR